MLDIKFIRENPEKVKKGAEDKGIKIDIDEIIQLDKEVVVLRKAQQELLEERNKAARWQRLSAAMADRQRQKTLKKVKKLRKKLMTSRQSLNH